MAADGCTYILTAFTPATVDSVGLTDHGAYIQGNRRNRVRV